jgi:transposase-like protein
VVRAPRTRESGVTLVRVAKDLGTHEMTRTKWLRNAGVGAGSRSGTTTADAAELRELKKRKRLLEQETRSYDVLRPICRRRTCPQIVVSARPTVSGA